ncbi:hypothetical protein M405DRAFT_930142 [Rhizopogon salebrosus TDB-379]|nr:hypothetical protein M405DRAFT_930142 [Rhizopogon salebrosus TDB-379]
MRSPVAHTMTPESWRVLFSQRRRWINSTIYNLRELVVLPELCGFCGFSMRFFVFIDLLGTIILPATIVCLAYLIVVQLLLATPLCHSFLSSCWVSPMVYNVNLYW